MHSALDVPDPRTFPEPGAAPVHARRLHRLAAESLEADVGTRADALDREIRAALAAAIEGEGGALATLIDAAPSSAIARHLWRQLDAVVREATVRRGELSATMFALPVVVVAGTEDRSRAATLPAVLAEPSRLAGLLEQHGALGGNRNFGLANALVAAASIDVARLPALLAWQRLADDGCARVARSLPPAPLRVAEGAEGVHLRFLIGSAVAPAGVDPLASRDVGAWGLPFARELGRQLAVQGVTVLALPRAPDRLLPAVRFGQLARREVAAEIFCGNALRRLRASAGEPVAVISAHRCAEAPAGGELRLSLASSFTERGAEGFRCPLATLDRVQDVVAMLTELLADCRVADVRTLAGVHPDRDPATGRTLLFGPDTIPTAPLH